MAERTDCSVCGVRLGFLGHQVVVVAGVRYHGWCYLTVCAPGAPKGED